MKFQNVLQDTHTQASFKISLQALLSDRVFEIFFDSFRTESKQNY